MIVKTYRDLIIWQKSKKLVIEIYKIIDLLPKEERFALSDQMRRAAISIPSNIAEGQRKFTTRDFVRFLNIADGSLAELMTQLEICKEIYPFIDENTNIALAQCEEISRMINSLIHKLRTNIKQKTAKTTKS